MKFRSQYKTIAALLFITQFSLAQKKDENIGTEVVNVVKPYTPTISDAFKVKETPSFEDEETANKENIKYNIFSFPVASTFTPSKGKAAAVDKSAQEKIYDNYLTLAAGNYGTANAELFITQSISSTDYFGGMLRHKSSQGGIKDVVLDDKFFDTSLDLTYGSKTRALSWNADLGYKNQNYNWYGLNPSLYAGLSPQDLDLLIDGIDEKQTYHTVSFGGRLGLNESVFKDGSIKFIRFWDAFSSGENRFYAKPNFAFEINDVKIKANVLFDYINGTFKKDYFGMLEDIKYGYANIGLNPSFELKGPDYSVNLGATFMYSAASQGGQTKFLIYPAVTASYKVVGDLMIAYGGAEGQLKQNSYHDFVQENFFVSPTLGIAPTDQKFDIYAGLKGKLANSVGYNIRASYLNEDNKALFKNNGFDLANLNEEGYAYGNSFGVVYDNIKTLSFYGELKADFSKNVTFGLSGTFSSYATGDEEEPWNLPGINVAANLDFNITPKWYAGTKVFFVGERKDQWMSANSFNPADVPVIETVTLDSYFDLNAHLGYKHNERLTFFLKGNNLANQQYQRWINYPVQGVQVLAGASYKFDF